MDMRRVVIHRGLCGINLRVQCLAIGILFTLLSFIAMVYGSLILHKPFNFISLSNTRTVHDHHVITGNKSDVGEEEESGTDELEHITMNLIKEVENNGMEILIGGLMTFLVSVLLIQGIRQKDQFDI